MQIFILYKSTCFFLGIRLLTCFTAALHSLIRLDRRRIIVGRAALDKAVGRCDTGDIGAMLALSIIQMRDRGVVIHIMIAIGDLG